MRNFLTWLFGARIAVWLVGIFTAEFIQYIMFILCSVAYMLGTIYLMQWPLWALVALIVYGTIVMFLHSRFISAGGANAGYTTVLNSTRSTVLTVAAVLVLFTLFAWQWPKLWLPWRFSYSFAIVLAMIWITVQFWNDLNRITRRTFIVLTAIIIGYGMHYSYKNSEKEKIAEKETEETTTEELKSETTLNNAKAAKIQHDIDQKFIDEIQAIQNQHADAYGQWDITISPSAEVDLYLPDYSWISITTYENGDECTLQDSKGVEFTCNGKSIVDGNGSGIEPGKIVLTSKKPVTMNVRIFRKTSEQIIEHRNAHK